MDSTQPLMHFYIKVTELLFNLIDSDVKNLYQLSTFQLSPLPKSEALKTWNVRFSLKSVNQSISRIPAKQ